MKAIVSLISDYDFIRYAFFAGMMNTLCASLLGVTIALKRLSMLGDGLSHISFGAIAIASAIGVAPLKLAIPVASLASVALFLLSGKKMKGDSGIAVISTGALSIGILVISYTGSGADMNNYLVGSLYSVTKEDLILCVVLCIVVIFSFIFLYNKIFSITFDEDFSTSVGIKTRLYSCLIAVLTAITVVIGMQLMGALLISALIVFPALSAMRMYKSFFAVTLCSVIVSAVCFFAGFALTLVVDSVPTGASIALVNLLMYVVFTFVSGVKKL